MIIVRNSWFCFEVVLLVLIKDGEGSAYIVTMFGFPHIKSGAELNLQKGRWAPSLKPYPP